MDACKSVGVLLFPLHVPVLLWGDGDEEMRRKREEQEQEEAPAFSPCACWRKSSHSCLSWHGRRVWVYA